MNADNSIPRIRYFDFSAPAALTLRAAGDCGGLDPSAVERRDQVFREYYRATASWSHICHMPRQVHRRRVRVVSPRATPASLRNTDGLISAHRAHSLAIVVADCLPIYLTVPARGIIALLHSGRKSTGILDRALAILRRAYRVAPADVHLLFGPAIASCCYEVDADIAHHYRRRWGKDTAIVRNERYYLDIARANERIARRAGVGKVDVIRDCTCCNSQYHSYRRDGRQSAQRMMAIISHQAL